MTASNTEQTLGYRPFVVITRSRTGSNMLMSLLDSHPAIIARGELVTRLGESTLADVLGKIFKPHSSAVQAVGFKAFYYHPNDGDSEELWQYLREMGATVIHLRRRNILRTYMSREIAAQRDVWKLKDEGERGGVSERTVTLNTRKMLKAFEQTRAWEIETAERWADSDLLTVEYEELAADPSGQVRRICERLGVEFAEVSTDLRKQNPEPVWSLLENYDEVDEALAGTEWESFLDTD